MANTMRWRYGETNPVVLPVASATVIEIGDLVYLDTTAKPASSLSYGASLAATQEAFHDKFAGVAMQASRNGDTQDIRVATTGVFEFGCASATFEVGARIGVDDNAGATALLNQQGQQPGTDRVGPGDCQVGGKGAGGQHLLCGPAELVAAADLVPEPQRRPADFQDRDSEAQPVAMDRGPGEVAGQMDGRGRPAFGRDHHMPGKAKPVPELLDHAVQHVEIGRVISGAGDVAIAEPQVPLDDQAGCHGAAASVPSAGPAPDQGPFFRDLPSPGQVRGRIRWKRRGRRPWQRLPVEPAAG